MKNYFIISIVLYHPTITMIGRVKKIANNGYKFFLYDNTKIKTEAFDNIENIYYYHSGRNVGLSGALDYIVDKAYKDAYYAVLNFDQDTIFTLSTLHFVEEVIDTYLLKKVLGKNIVSVTFRDFYKTKNTNLLTIQNEYFNYANVNFTINSGTLYFLEYYKKFTWFNKYFFVDGLDYNFCIESNKQNFKNLEIYNTPELNHRTEQDDSDITIFKIELRGRKYSSTRNVDFLKSHLYLLKQTIVYLQPQHFLYIFKSILAYIFSQTIFLFKK